MRIRVWGFGLVSRYALGHLSCLILLAFASKSVPFETLAFLILGFPLLDLLALVFDPHRLLPPGIRVVIVVTVGVANSYLWGIALAYAHRRWLNRVNVE